MPTAFAISRFLRGREVGILCLHQRQGALLGLGQQALEGDVIPRARLHELPVFPEDAAKRDEAQPCLDAHFARGGEDLLEMQLLRRAHDVPDLVRRPAFHPVLDGRQIRGGVKKAAIPFPDEARLLRQGRLVVKEDADRPFADLRNPALPQPLHQRREAVVVLALAQALVEGDIEHLVHAFEFAPRKGDAFLPDPDVLSIALLEPHQLLAALAEHLPVLLGQRMGLLVEPHELRHRLTLQRRVVPPVFPPVDDLAELRAPIPQVIIA